MAKHTPGPWHVAPTKERDRFMIEAADGSWLASTLSYEDMDRPGQSEANARLVARAPALLEAVAYLFPRVHRHLVDPDKLREIAGLVREIEGAP